MAVLQKRAQREKRRARIRRTLMGTPERPRLSVYRSNTHVYAQLVDDLEGHTLASADSRQFQDAENRTEAAKRVGEEIARKAKEAGYEAVVFDRGGNKYHGRIAALADGARESGLKL